MRIEPDIKLDFSDVLIRPKRTTDESRKNIKLDRIWNESNVVNCNNTIIGVPIIAANMFNTGTFSMARAMAKLGCFTALHKHYPIDSLIDFFSLSREEPVYNTFYTLGITDDDFDKIKYIIEINGELSIPLICIDVANGYMSKMLDKVKILKEICPHSTIMVGNVCTPDITLSLLEAGASIVKIGIGPGSKCLTRQVTGVGYPQLSAIIECADAAHGIKGLVCADGGCRYSDDINKAFGGGADFVMLGGMLMGTDECEGEWQYTNKTTGGKYENGNHPPLRVHDEIIKYKLKTFGMASREANEQFYGELANYKSSEGKCEWVDYKGPVYDTVSQIMGGMRSACMYIGASSLKDFSKCTTFVRIR